jgi:transcription initiation factor TFIID TATA-box-binding protein
LKEKGFLIKEEPIIEIQNIVASIDLFGRIDLELAEGYEWAAIP